MNEAKQTRFTMHEMPITMVLIRNFLSVDAPGRSSFTYNSRISGTANELHASH